MDEAIRFLQSAHDGEGIAGVVGTFSDRRQPMGRKVLLLLRARCADVLRGTGKLVIATEIIDGLLALRES